MGCMNIYAQLIFDKVQMQLSEERIVFSTNGTGIF